MDESGNGSGFSQWGFWIDGRLVDGLRVTRAVWRRVLWLLVPLALQVVLFKLIKYAVLQREGGQAVAQEKLVTSLFIEHAPLPLLLGGLAFCLAAFLLMRWPSLTTAFVPLFLLFFAGTAGLLRFLLSFRMKWLSGAFFEVVRGDLLLIFILATVALLVIHNTRGKVRSWSIALLHIITLILMVLASMDFGYFVMTGSLADAYLLRYSFSNISDLSFAMSYELSGPKLAFLVFPFLVVAAPVLVERLSARRWDRRRRGVGTVAFPALLLLVAPHFATPPDVEPITGSTFGQLVRGFFSKPVWESEAVAHPADAPLFDTRRIRFVPTEEVRRMNVVLIILESTRARSVTPYEPALGTTPFLDSLARRSLLVEHMYAVVPHTNKALTPVLCGVYPEINQGEQARVPGACLPRLLEPFGYASAFFTPARLDFERKDVMLADMGYEETYGGGDYPEEGFFRVNYFGFEDRIMMKPSLAWIDRQRAAGTPFFLTYLTLTSHHPYQTPISFERRAFAKDDPDLNAYLNTLAYTDAFLADLFAAFEARGLIDETVFVIVGDHGEAFAEHGRRFHSAVIWDEGLQVPALIFSPALFPEGERITGPRQQTDILPTVADALGFSLEGGRIPGRSLFEPVPANRKLYHSGWIENQSMAVREGTKKFIYHYRRRPMEVYDVAEDPYERRNLAGQYSEERLEVVEMELLLWRKRVNDLYRALPDGR
ncbi:LTA synthase family protein [Rhodocaloribacter sp.]